MRDSTETSRWASKRQWIAAAVVFAVIGGFVWWAQFDRTRQHDRAESECNALMKARVPEAPEMYLEEQVSDDLLRFHVGELSAPPGWTCFAEKVDGDWTYDLFKD